MKTIKILNYIFIIALGFFAVMFGIDQFGSKTTTVYTEGYCDTIKGYNDNIPMEIVITDNRIESIKILKNHETPGFFKKVTDAKLVEKFYGRSPQEAESLVVDGVSGATYSSNAVIQTIKTRMKAYTQEGAGANDNPWTWQLFGIIGCAVILLVLNVVAKKYN